VRDGAATDQSRKWSRNRGNCCTARGFNGAATDQSRKL